MKREYEIRLEKCDYNAVLVITEKKERHIVYRSKDNGDEVHRYVLEEGENIIKAAAASFAEVQKRKDFIQENLNWVNYREREKLRKKEKFKSFIRILKFFKF
jgi:hypothetical protein